jgi:hypothetical protein
MYRYLVHIFKFSQKVLSGIVSILTCVPDPGSDAFLTPGSRIGFSRISDPGSQTYMFESIVTCLWLKSQLAQIFLCTCSK